MSTASFYDRSVTPKPYGQSGSKSHFFQPPGSSSSSTPSRNSSKAYQRHDDPLAPGKRRRNDSLRSGELTPKSVTSSVWSTLSTESPSMTDSSQVLSPPPLVDTRYKLASGLATPSSTISSGFEELPSVSDITFRRGGEANHGAGHVEDYFGRMPAALDREGNGRSRAYQTPSHNDGWGQTIVATVSGVAGKVWEFCKVGAFRGFRAGGTQGVQSPLYHKNDVQSSIWQDLPSPNSDVFNSCSNTTSAKIPGGFPQSSSPSTTPPRPGKRPKVDSSSSWVLVPPHTSSSRSPSPTRIASRKLPSSASTPTARRPASSAGLRRPILPASRPSLGYASTNRTASSASTRSPLPSPKRASHSRANSYGGTAGTADLDGSPREVPESPVSAETQRYAARLKKREREEDRALKGFNERLKAMIREGKEALGTKIEVEMDDVDDDGI